MEFLVYEPLVNDEFRLLTLLPGSEEPVRCALRTARLGNISFHEEGIYVWSDQNAIAIKNKSRLNRLLSLPDRALRGHKSDIVLKIGLRVVGAGSAGHGAPTVTATKGPDKTHKTPIGGGFYIAIHGSTSQDNGQQPSEWTKDQLPFVPEYEALSYMWGPPTPTATIIVNGCAIEVRRNLHDALLQLRGDVRARDLWVDALCIDQLNMEERAMQVSRMPSIYQRARHVIAWLGAPTGTSPKAFELLEQLGQRKSVKQVFRRGRAETSRWTKSQKALPKIEPHSQQALQDLLTRPYWKRAWIIQELAYARGITLVCGNQSLDWSTFQTAITRPDCERFSNGDGNQHWFCNFLQESGFIFLQNNRSRTREPNRAHGLESRSATLLRTLESAWDFQSSDPRDKVYALLGLPSLDDDMSLPPLDYSKSVSYIFCTTAKAIIKYERALNILCLHHSSEEPNPHRLPSWTPDWTKRLEQGPLLFDVFPSRPKYCAAGLTCVEGSEWEVTDDGRRIDVWAHSLGVGAVKQRNIFATRFFRKRLKAPVEPIPSTREQRAEEYDDRQMQLRGSEFFGNKDGLTARTLGTLSSSELGDPYKLVVNGFVVSSIVSKYRAVTVETIASGEWKNIIREWDCLVDGSLPTTDDTSADFPPHAHFLWTVMKGHFEKISDEIEKSWFTIFYEKYLVWAGWLEIDRATYRRGHHLVDDVETVLKRAVGWKFALSNKGDMAMVPARAREGDLICVLFGADVPMILRRRSLLALEPSYEFLGPAYVHQIMFGEALEKFTNGDYHRSTFTIT